MSWKKLTDGLETIFGCPGTHLVEINRVRLEEFRLLMRRLGLQNLRSRDIADGYLSILPRSQRSGKGVFYTPHKVVEYILDETLPKPRFGKKASVPYPPDFRILEPACGTGYFLLGAYRRLRDAYRRAKIEPSGAVRMILEKHIAAIDIDPDALLIALSAVLKEAGDEIDSALESGPIKLAFHRADFLDKDFDKENHSLGRLLKGGFPVIVGNPPYISFYAKRAKAISAMDRAYYQQNYRMGKGRINTYCLFIERAFDLLQPSGVLGYIIPNTMLIMKSYEPLRKHILENGWIRSIVDLSLKVFPEVEVPTCVIAVEKRDTRALQFPRHVTSGFWESARSEGPDNLESINQSKFENLPYSMFNIHIRSDDSAILDAIEKAGSPLAEFCEVRDGINPANMTKKLVTFSEESLDQPFKPVLRGRDIGPYQLNWDNMWVRYDREFANKAAGEYCFLREERIFIQNPKILTRQTADRLIAAWDNEGFYALNTIHVTVPRNGDIDLKFLIALYNSKLLNYYYRRIFPDTEKLFPQVKTVNVEKLPIPSGNGEIERLSGLVDKMIRLEKNGINMKARQDTLETIDRIVFSLYDLNPEQIARIEHTSYT